MNCDFCSNPVTDDASASVPCCDRIYHTACLVKKTVLETHNGNYYGVTTIQCGCQAPIYTEVNAYSAENTDTTQTETLLQNPQNRAEIKQIKRKNTIMNNSRIVFNRFLRQRKIHFKAAIQPYIYALTAAKQAEGTAIKNSSEWKDYMKHHRSVSSAFQQFQQKHNLNQYTLLSIFHRSLRYRYHNRPQRLLSKFLRTQV